MSEPMTEAERCVVCRPHDRHVGRCPKCECWCGHPRAIEAEARAQGAAAALGALTLDVVREVLLVRPAPPHFSAYAEAVRARLIDRLAEAG